VSLAYDLLTSESTVQVVSPTVVNPIVYCTIRTKPSLVVASVPVDQTEFEVNGTGPILEATAEAIETVMADSRVVAGVGTQTLDSSNLLADQVAFTVQYVPPGTSGTSITAEALVPITILNFSQEPRDQINAPAVFAIIDGVYANLQNAAGG
jgi:hypothetical protein